MNARKWLYVIAILVLLNLLFLACKKEAANTAIPQETATQAAGKTEVAPTPTEAPPVRKGAWVDTVVFTEQNSASAAVAQLNANELDIYAYTVNEAELFESVKANSGLTYSQSVGGMDAIQSNPYGPVFNTGKLNPFSNPKIRESLNWLIDRNYIVQEFVGGLGIPKLTSLSAAFPDYARYVDIARELEAYYAYNPDKAKAQITEAMEAMGATLLDGKWQYSNEPVTIIFIIRVEDERQQIGDYMANQLESVGFTVDRQYKTRTEAAPIWNQSNPADGLWHLYTAGWIQTAISRDDGANFSSFYTPRGSSSPLWQNMQPSSEFDALALKLETNDFTTMVERRDLFEKALRLSMQDSEVVFVLDTTGFSAQRAELLVSYDLAGAVAGHQLWPFTMRFAGKEGGTVRVAQPGILVEPWNPLAGSNQVYDLMPIRGTGDHGVMRDPFTGLVWPQRIESASVTVKEGLPVDKTLDWLSLEFVPEITVPADAWVDWDAIGEKFITAGEKFTQTQTANVKVVVRYPDDLFETVKWHDGSPLSVGDFVMFMIMAFDPAKPESYIYDEGQVPGVEGWMSHFKGVRIISTDPLVIETYDDAFQLDAEISVLTMNFPNYTWFPWYSQGPGAWHNMALGVRADASKELAFSATKADTLQVDWMNFISGPSLDILKKYLDKSTEDNYLPYAPTLGLYITPAEVKARWANLQAWYAARGHFWLGTGPFYLEAAYPVEGMVTLQRFADYPDPVTKWSGFSEPKLSIVEVDGPGRITLGTQATFDIFVTFKDKPYPQAEIGEVKYLLFDTEGKLVTVGVAAVVKDGQYEIILSADQTNQLQAGSNTMEVAVVSKMVSIPSFASFQFVTAAP